MLRDAKIVSAVASRLTYNQVAIGLGISISTVGRGDLDTILQR
jgi:DNA-binding CsgD family transcriptional regulator